MQRLVVRLAGQLCMHIAQIFVSGRVTRIGADRHVERGARLVVLTAGREQHRQVVVRLRQIRMVLGQFGEDGNGFSSLALLRQDHAFYETHLHVARVLRQKTVDLDHRFTCLPGPHQFGDIREIIGQRERTR